MKLQTPVIDNRCKVGISYNDKITMLGSCLSDVLGKSLRDYGFDICVNPFGALYNPVSVLKGIERLISGQKFEESDCITIGAGDERVCSFSHYTAFARNDRESFLENANRALEEAHRHFSESTKVIVNLGTAWCYRNRESGQIVSNCLKRPAAEFIRERLSSEETAACLRRMMELCPDKEFIFTVCPIRHLKDGAHGNQLSKSTLLLGIESILCGNGTIKADYFPAYEIVMDELRDYRFYAEDMSHPTQQTSGYLLERLLKWGLPEEEHPTLENNIRSFRHSQHRPSHATV